MAKQIYIPKDREKAVWRAWERLAADVTPDTPTGYTMKVSTLFVLIGERAISNPQKVAALVKEIANSQDW